MERLIHFLIIKNLNEELTPFIKLARNTLLSKVEKYNKNSNMRLKELNSVKNKVYKKIKICLLPSMS